MPDAVATALAWGGLHKTTVWQTKSDTTSVKNINWIARDTLNSINSPTFQLTNCK